MKKALQIIIVLGLFVAFFFPKELALNSKRICIGFKVGGIETTDAPPTGPSVSISNTCFGIILGNKTTVDNIKSLENKGPKVVY